MLATSLRLIGGYLGFIATQSFIARFVFSSTGGEAAIANGMALWTGGWMIVLFCYALGITIGLFGIIPTVSLLVAVWQQLSVRYGGKFR